MGKTEQQNEQDPTPKKPVNWNVIIPLSAIFGLMVLIQTSEGAEAIPQPAWGAVGVIIGYIVGGGGDS